MAIIAHVDARELAKGGISDTISDIQDQLYELSTTVDNTKSLAEMTHENVDEIAADYVTSKNVSEKFRSSLPRFWNQNPVDYDTLPFGDHLLWDFATGETHAPPVPTAQWMFVEMIKTFDYPPNGLPSNAVQRAWGYKLGFMATRSRYQGKWSKWSVATMTEDTRPQTMPQEPMTPDKP